MKKSIHSALTAALGLGFIAVPAIAQVAPAMAAPTPQGMSAFAVSTPTGEVTVRGSVNLPDGTSVIVGSFTGTITAGGTSYVSKGGTDAFRAQISPQGSLMFASTGGGTGNDVATGVAASSDGRTIAVTGTFQGSATFFGLPQTLTSRGGNDIFVTSQSSAGGTLQWATSGGGTGDDISAGVAFSGANMAIVGSVNSAGKFGNLTAGPLYGGTDSFGGWLSSTGTWTYQVTGGGTGNDGLTGIAVNPYNGSYNVVGYFTGTGALFGGYRANTLGGQDIFAGTLAKIFGTWAGATTAGGTTDDTGTAIATAEDGTGIITGVTGAKNAWFGSKSVNSANGNVAFVSRINLMASTPSGGGARPAAGWISTATTGLDSAVGSNVTGRGISVTSNNSNIVITGAYTGTNTFGTTTLTSKGQQDVFTMNLDGDMNIKSALSAGGTGQDIGASVSAYADGSALVTGAFTGSPTFGGVTIKGFNANLFSGFVAKQNTTGTDWQNAFVDSKPPTNVTAVAGNTSATVSWTAPTNTGGTPLTGYDVAFATAASGPWTTAKTGVAGTTSTVTGLTNGTPYWFQVKAVNSVGSSTGAVTSTSTTPQATYECPAGYSPTGPVSANTVCTKSYDATYVDTSTYTCPTGGTLSGQTCVVTTNATYVDTSYYSCPSGYTLSGTNCVKSYAATVNTVYSCPQGGSLSGTTCTVKIAATASTSYSCPTGYTLSGSSCSTTFTETTGPSSTQSNAPQCSTLGAGWVGQGTFQNASGQWFRTCTKTVTEGAESITTYSCPSGYSLSGVTCSKTYTGTPTTANSCPNGGTLSGTTCTLSVSPTVSTAYSCPSGWTLSGTSCTITWTQWTGPSSTQSNAPQCSTLGADWVGNGAFETADGKWYRDCSLTQTQAALATTTYTCPSGYTLSGVTCGQSYAASGTSYSCPTGGNLSGTSCVTVVPATYVNSGYYTCPSGSSLSGSTCTSTYAATVVPSGYYTCPDGGALSNSTCTLSATPVEVQAAAKAAAMSTSTFKLKAGKAAKSADKVPASMKAMSGAAV